MADNCGSCGCETVLVNGGPPGPQGPAGPQGPPGAGATFPIPAVDISVTNPGFANLQEALDYLLYIPLTIDLFSTPVTTYMIGGSVSNLTFNWALNKVVITKTISGSNTSPVSLTTSPTVVSLSPSLNPGAVGTSYTYTLTADDGVNTETADVIIAFENNVYFGDSTVPGAINSAFVNGLGYFTQAGRAKTVFSNATGLTTYAWFAHRAALGIATFTVGGFAGGFEAPVTISHTNASGFTESYYVYRSTNPAIGPVTYVVS